MKKGLRHKVPAVVGLQLRNTDRPDEEGIKTTLAFAPSAMQGNTDRPDEEGIKTVVAQVGVEVELKHRQT